MFLQLATAVKAQVSVGITQPAHQESTHSTQSSAPCTAPTLCVYLQQLVMCKMQLAELNESYVSVCHDLHKSKEKNLAIAAKMTRYGWQNPVLT